MVRRLVFPFLSFLVVACGGPGTYDFDGDGSADSVDCAPDDSSIHPGATESCSDSIDNDCDNQIDCEDSDCAVSAECDMGDDDDDSGGSDNADGSSPLRAALSCLRLLNDDHSIGDATYWLKPDNTEAFQAHCDMTTLEGGWTLIEAYDITLDDQYVLKPFFGNDMPRNENSPNWDDYRLGSKRMTSLITSATQVHARCHRTFSESVDDWFIGSVNLVNGLLASAHLPSQSNGTNPYSITGKIRTHSAGDYNWVFAHGSSETGQLHAQFDAVASGIPESMTNEASFVGSDGDPVNLNHGCNVSSGEIVWMVR